MTRFCWLRNLFVARSRKDRRRLTAPNRKPVRLVLEQLETRLTPSATLSTLAFFNDIGPTGLVMDGSGNLYGTMGSGGASNDGTITELAKGSGTITTLAFFNGTNGAVPTSLMTDGSGDLYGTTSGGGASDDGTIFELAKGSSTITTLASFNGTNGASPNGGLVMDSSGNLYGTTENGGASETPDGTVFELAKGSSTITTLASFNGSNGASPYGSLIMDGSGNLYGTTAYGGGSNPGSNDGTIFELAKGSSTFTTLASFNGTNDQASPSGLIMDSSGNLYGTTGSGGASEDGTVFELTKGSSTITTLASFNGTNGYDPNNLIMDGSGNLYGTTENGGTANNGLGTIFELANGSSTVTTLASFNGDNGSAPQAGLIMDGSGNLYGTTFFFQSGTVFELAKGSSTITTLASFNGTNGGTNPSAGLIMDGSGNLYGTTTYGGASANGTVFELAKGSGTITTLASFVGNGDDPEAGLIMDGSGDLYGTTMSTVFELAKGSSTITTLASFNATNVQGSDYPSALIMDSSGNLYGTTEYGRASDDGSIFELAKGSSTITTLASFDSTNGSVFPSSLVMDSSGNLYGTSGGNTENSTIFELAKGSSTITTLASFNGTADPSGLIMDSSGNLYGTTFFGGTVFELAKGSSTITTLATFNGFNGGYDPEGGLIMDGSGNLYGTTLGGGPSGDGTVFELAKGSNTITTLASFNGSIAPFAPAPSGLIIDGNGNLYGTTKYGGPAGQGTIFELQTSTNGNTAPVITGQPISQTVTAGANVTFTASASGNPTPTVQWYVNSGSGFVALSNGNNISGATSDTLTLSNVTTAMSGYEYEAVFGNSAGSKTTNAATLTVSQSLSPPPSPPASPVLPSPPASPAPPALNVPPLLALFDSLLGGTETVNANGTETVTDSFFGIPLLVSTFDSSGKLESVTLFGINVTALFELL
jgi:uncharacterized repeat protein (TIGR03803 family)